MQMLSKDCWNYVNLAKRLLKICEFCQKKNHRKYHKFDKNLGKNANFLEKSAENMQILKKNRAKCENFDKNWGKINLFCWKIGEERLIL